MLVSFNIWDAAQKGQLRPLGSQVPDFSVSPALLSSKLGTCRFLFPLSSARRRNVRRRWRWDDDGVDSRILHLSSVAGLRSRFLFSTPVPARLGRRRGATSEVVAAGGCLVASASLLFPQSQDPSSDEQWTGAPLETRSDTPEPPSVIRACTRTPRPAAPPIPRSQRLLVVGCEAGLIAATWRCAQHPASIPCPIDTITVDMRCLCRARKRTQEGG
jgi:hypothetical protein